MSIKTYYLYFANCSLSCLLDKETVVTTAVSAIALLDS